MTSPARKRVINHIFFLSLLLYVLYIQNHMICSSLLNLSCVSVQISAEQPRAASSQIFFFFTAATAATAAAPEKGCL